MKEDMSVELNLLQSKLQSIMLKKTDIRETYLHVLLLLPRTSQLGFKYSLMGNLRELLKCKPSNRML